MGTTPRTVRYLRANKTNMVKLIRTKGFSPTVKRARFEKAFRARSYWLTWMESSGLHEALLMTAGGRTYLRIKNQTTGDEGMNHIPLAELEKFNLVEVKEI